MRIISGDFKGKKILEPMDFNTRPLKDLAKESIFNIILHSNKFEINLRNSNILDLFSGVGSFGIECLSRGVKKVIFIENYKGVLPILKKNIQSLKSINNYQIYENDIYSENTFSAIEIKFDIIFLDTPYKYKNLDTIFQKIKNNNILNENGIIILHRHKNEKESFPHYIKIIEKKIYGISVILFLSMLK